MLIFYIDAYENIRLVALVQLFISVIPVLFFLPLFDELHYLLKQHLFYFFKNNIVTAVKAAIANIAIVRDA